jgi:hypothetical protein
MRPVCDELDTDIAEPDSGDEDESQASDVSDISSSNKSFEMFGVDEYSAIINETQEQALTQSSTNVVFDTQETCSN